MEVKKSPKYDLQNKKGMFLQIGLVVSLGLMIVMFHYSQKEKTIQQIDLGLAVVEDQIVEITRQDQKPPEPVKQTIAVVSDILNVVKNDTKITTEMTTFDFSEDVSFTPVAKKAEAVQEDDAPFLVVEDMPKFQGGDLSVFRKWVLERLKFPQTALESGVSGRVTLSFVIEKDGSLTNIQVITSPDQALSDEAIRVLKMSPKWTPGKQRNMAVRVKYNLPVDFRVQN